MWLPFDKDETFGLLWICSNAFSAYVYYRKFRCADSIYKNIKNAPTIETNLTEYGSGENISFPYAKITGKIQHLGKPLVCSDGKTSGVIHSVQKYTENLLYIPFLLKYGIKSNASYASEIIPFQVYNEKTSTLFNIESPAADSPTMTFLEQTLPVVSMQGYAKKDSIASWIVEIIPGCNLFVKEVVKEKMLPINAAVTVIGKVLIGKHGIVSVSNPGNANAPYIITVLSSQEILKKIHQDTDKQLGFSVYFGTITVGLILLGLIDLYRQSKGKRRLNFYNTSVNMYLFFVTFTTWFPDTLWQYLCQSD